MAMTAWKGAPVTASASPAATAVSSLSRWLVWPPRPASAGVPDRFADRCYGCPAWSAAPEHPNTIRDSGILPSAAGPLTTPQAALVCLSRGSAAGQVQVEECQGPRNTRSATVTDKQPMPAAWSTAARRAPRNRIALGQKSVNNRQRLHDGSALWQSVNPGGYGRKLLLLLRLQMSSWRHIRRRWSIGCHTGRWRQTGGARY